MFDNDEIINCPACDRRMQKIFIESANVYVDVCLDGCGGIYFDNREFKKMDEQSENIDNLLSLIEGREFVSVDETVQRKCPVCGAIMHKNYSSIKKEIQVDDCYACGGKFLDKGELQKIRNEYGTDSERLSAVLDFINGIIEVEAGPDVQN